MDLATQRRLATYKRKFRERVFKTDLNSTWIVLKKKQLWDADYADYLFTILLAQIESVPLRASKRKVAPILIECTDASVEPRIVVILEEISEEAVPETDIPIPVQPFVDLVRSVHSLGLSPNEVLLHILDVVKDHFPSSVQESIRDHLSSQDKVNQNKLSDNPDPPSPEFNETSLFSPKNYKGCSLFEELVGKSDDHVYEEIPKENDYLETVQAEIGNRGKVRPICFEEDFEFYAEGDSEFHTHTEEAEIRRAAADNRKFVQQYFQDGFSFDSGSEVNQSVENIYQNFESESEVNQSVENIYQNFESESEVDQSRGNLYTNFEFESEADQTTYQNF